MKLILIIFSMSILYSCTSISQTNKIYFENIGNCSSSFSSHISLIKSEGDSIKTSDYGCTFKTSPGSNHYFNKKQFYSLDSLIKTDSFFKPFSFDEKKDTTLFPKSRLMSETDKFPTGTYLVTSYDNKCNINYQYLLEGAENTKKMFNLLQQKMPYKSKDWEIFLDFNITLVDVCVDLMEDNK